MNIYWWIVFIAIGLSLFMGIKEKSMVYGLLFGVPTFAIGILISVAMMICVYDSVKDIEGALDVVVNDSMTNEEIGQDIISLLNDATKNNSFDVEISIADVYMNGLTVKNVEVNFKYPIFSKYVYVNSNNVFKLYVKKTS